MHGRLKIRTTEEEKERKKKEQALKVKAYRAAMTKIQTKRQQQELDDELLLLTSQILLRNPDVTTCWNVRRECVIRKSEASDYDAELGLTEQCLIVNPKSYGAWHHRCWTLEHSPNANWNREMQLCNKYLKLDERNFITWNFRRYVVAKAGVEKQKELDFCTDKIKANFSNYSSWHYRSLLLPELHPYEGDALMKRPMSEIKLQEELEMVLTAAFTDPNDSSAWFYQRWLLGYSRPELDICAFRCDTQKAVLAFTKPVTALDLCVNLYLGSAQNELKILNWRALNQTSIDTTWVAKMSVSDKQIFEVNVGCQLEVDIPAVITQKLSLKMYANSFYYFNPPNRSLAFSAAVVTELQSQLESCMSLLEYEPDSKWTLLTSALLMRAINSQEYHIKSLQHLEKLQKVDSLREGYFKDLAAKWIMEKILTDWSDSTGLPHLLKLTDEPQLNMICQAQYLTIADEIELSASLKEVYNDSHSKIITFGGIDL